MKDPEVDRMLEFCFDNNLDLSNEEWAFVEQCNRMVVSGLGIFSWRLDKLREIYRRIKPKKAPAEGLI